MPRSKSKRKRKNTFRNSNTDVFITPILERPLIKDANRLYEKLSSEVERGLDIHSVILKYESEIDEVISKIDNAKLRSDKLTSEIDQLRSNGKTIDNDQNFCEAVTDLANLELEISISSQVLHLIAEEYGNSMEHSNQPLKNASRTKSLKEFCMKLLIMPVGWIARLVFQLLNRFRFQAVRN